MRLIQSLVKEGIICSFAEGRRLIASNAVTVNGIIVNNLNATLNEDDVVRVGKRHGFIFGLDDETINE